MTDAVRLEERGIPTITLVLDVFKRAADLYAEMAGRRGLRFIVFPSGRVGQADDEIARYASDVTERIAALLAGEP